MKHHKMVTVKRFFRGALSMHEHVSTNITTQKADCTNTRHNVKVATKMKHIWTKKHQNTYGSVSK